MFIPIWQYYLTLTIQANDPREAEAIATHAIWTGRRYAMYFTVDGKWLMTEYDENSYLSTLNIQKMRDNKISRLYAKNKL